jgi:hypothetical protein
MKNVRGIECWLRRASFEFQVRVLPAGFSFGVEKDTLEITICYGEFCWTLLPAR